MTSPKDSDEEDEMLHQRIMRQHAEDRERVRQHREAEENRRDEMLCKVSEIVKDEYFEKFKAVLENDPKKAASYVTEAVEKLSDFKLGTSSFKIACHVEYEFDATMRTHDFSFYYGFLTDDCEIAKSKSVRSPESGEMINFKGELYRFGFRSDSGSSFIRGTLIHMIASLVTVVRDHFKDYKEMLHKIEQAKTNNNE